MRCSKLVVTVAAADFQQVFTALVPSLCDEQASSTIVSREWPVLSVAGACLAMANHVCMHAGRGTHLSKTSACSS